MVWCIVEGGSGASAKLKRRSWIGVCDVLSLARRYLEGWKEWEEVIGKWRNLSRPERARSGRGEEAETTTMLDTRDYLG